MTRVEQIKEVIIKCGFEVGCVSPNDSWSHLSNTDFKKVLEAVKGCESSNSNCITIKKSLIECEQTVDNELDVTIKSVSYYD